MSKSVLVAGGGGFLGSHLCEVLIEDGNDVYCLDNFGSGRSSNLSHLRDRDRFSVIESDLRENPSLPDVDEIYHLASRASPVDFTDFPERIALTNTMGTRYLLEYARKNDASLLFTSTSEVYGDPLEHPQSESYNGNVDIRGKRGCYDESKRFGETLMVVYHEKYSVDAKTVRIFNTYGPRMRPDDGRVVPTFVRQALAGDNITIHGDGSQTRTFCYVEDLIDGLVRTMDCQPMNGEVVNLGAKNEITIHELAEAILEQVNTESEIIYTEGREGDPSRRCPDISKAKELLDWNPSTDLETGLSKTIAYYQETLPYNPD